MHFWRQQKERDLLETILNKISTNFYRKQGILFCENKIQRLFYLFAKHTFLYHFANFENIDCFNLINNQISPRLFLSFNAGFLNNSWKKLSRKLNKNEADSSTYRRNNLRNLIKTLHEDTFTHLHQLSSLYLHNNMWDCSCKSIWLNDYVNSTSFLKCPNQEIVN